MQLWCQSHRHRENCVHYCGLVRCSEFSLCIGVLLTVTHLTQKVELIRKGLADGSGVAQLPNFVVEGVLALQLGGNEQLSDVDSRNGNSPVCIVLLQIFHLFGDLGEIRLGELFARSIPVGWGKLGWRVGVVEH